MKTQVGIIGAGPAGLLLAQLLRNAGIDSIIFEAKSEDYVIDRVRAGVLEQGSVDTLIQAGVGDNLKAKCLPHDGIIFRFDGKERYVDVKALSGGKVVTVYGQQSVVRDLIDARRSYSDVWFETPVTKLEDIKTDAPKIHYERNGEAGVLECDYIAGCDGFWGVSRPSLPDHDAHVVKHEYPYSWLGVLADAKPSSHVVIYSLHDHGFALASMRSETVSRLYLQVPNGENADDWPDDKVWDELELRLGNGIEGFKINRGPITQKDVAPMRSFVCEKMQHGRLFLAGDAAHIVPPTGAKGMNLAIADVRVLAHSLIEQVNHGNPQPLGHYTETCLDRIWKVERFSWWVTSMFHRDPEGTHFDLKMQQASLDYLTSSDIGGSSFAENYVGLPFAV
ncbi:MAG: 4-hydroxybenzoate 3-monooxygenase [Pseudomonadota bacterium]